MKRILVFEAHGDDMEFFAGGTIARFAALGHEVILCVATDNDKGSFERSAAEMRAVRDNELNGAAGVLGVKRVIPLGYSDGDLAYDAHPRELRGTFMRIIREVKPDIMFTWDPFTPYEGHPDHRAVATAANEAASFAHFPSFYPEQLREGLEPHYVGEQWYFAKSPRDQNKYVDIDGFIDKKIAALHAHEAQMVLTVQNMKYELEASGLDVPWLRDADPHDYHAIIDRQMRAAGRAVARRSGLDCEYAEGFRRVRFGGIESLAKGQTLPEDV
ncbi:MAG TPA: PIG-L deacetylase family protein [Dehalococcoidia bacterium]|nr:PIG-L deacetylase family protein [Dehalococcoidia bacterium]